MSIRSMLLRANDTLVILRPNVTQSASGGIGTTTWTIIGTITPAWIQPLKTSTRLLFMQREIACSHYIYCDRDPLVKTLDVLLPVATNTTTANGTIYDTVALAQTGLGNATRQLRVTGAYDTVELGRLWRIDCDETQSTV